jgi:flagellin-specific chaperone FliS
MFKPSVAQIYKIHQINGGNALDRLLLTYDAALIGCGQQDVVKTIQALSVLRDALDFNQEKELAIGLFKLYQYCLELVDSGEFEKASVIIKELKGVWKQAGPTNYRLAQKPI